MNSNSLNCELTITSVAPKARACGHVIKSHLAGLAGTRQRSGCHAFCNSAPLPALRAVSGPDPPPVVKSPSMGKVILRFKNSAGDETTVEKDATGRLELITEFDRRFVTEAEAYRLARAAGVSLSNSKPPTAQGGLPSLGKKR
jgi:hypothetical protein